MDDRQANFDGFLWITEIGWVPMGGAGLLKKCDWISRDDRQ